MHFRQWTKKPPISAHDSPSTIAPKHRSRSVNKGSPAQSTCPTPSHSHHYDCTNQQRPEYIYARFEEPIRVSGSKKNDFSSHIAAKYQDVETGLLFYGFRYYDPVTGRWPSRDPIEERGGLNLYAMVGNGPIGRFDHLGLWTITLGGARSIVTIESGDTLWTVALDVTGDGANWSLMFPGVDPSSVLPEGTKKDDMGGVAGGEESPTLRLLLD